MRKYALRLIVAAGVGTLLGSAVLAARSQSGAGGAAPHVATAKAAARQDHIDLFNNLCVPPPPLPTPGAAPQTTAQPQGPPPRAQWHAEPAKVFDNLYFLGQTEYTAWAVVTSDGIIVIDPLFDYSVEDEVGERAHATRTGSQRRSDMSSSAMRTAITWAARGFCRTDSAQGSS